METRLPRSLIGIQITLPKDKKDPSLNFKTKELRWFGLNTYADGDMHHHY